MATSFQPIFDKFIKKLRNDNQFFNYKNLTELEIEEMVNDHLNSLLDRGISKIYEYGIPDYDFYNEKDDTLQQFNEDLVRQEIALLTDLMYFSYIEESRNRLNSLGMTFRTSELNAFSQANERDSMMKLISAVEDKANNSIENYLARDRITWEYKSIYGGN